MNFVQQLEECLRDLAAEARKNHPGVKEASERATLKLRTLQNSYVSAVRQATSAGKEHPTTKLFQSSDLLHPFLLAANYPYATNALLEISFRAMKLLMEADAVVPSDGLNMVRVWMIQAHVVIAYYQKHFAKELKSMHSEERLVADANSLSGGSAATVATASSSGWFSWGSSSASTATVVSDPPLSTPLSETTSSSSKQLSVKNAVSSSSGQTGQGSLSSTAMDKVALEILSCLLQLVERLKGYPDSLTPELWSNAMSLACLWLYNTPNRHKVQQAAQSTTIQILELLYQVNSNSSMAAMHKLTSNTWQDLLTLATSSAKTLSLTGAFSLCRRAPGTAVAHPPSPEFALELMTQVWKDGKFRPNDALFIKTFSLTMALLEQVSKLSVERTLRALQWSSILFQRESALFPNECREIFTRIIKPIVSATDACRSHHDFEDGYVYTAKEASLEENSEIPSSDRGLKRRNENLACFFPRAVLWKASFSLDVLYVALDMESEASCVLFDDPRLIAQIAEALSHFATIGASCRDHMLQIVDFCQFQLVSNQKPTSMRRAEIAILSGDSAIFSTVPQKSSEKSNGNHPSVLGESIYFSLQSMLRIAYCLRDMKNCVNLLEDSFAPFLAILQHFMKRFSGSSSLVSMALDGYTFLSDVCLPLENNLMQRKALLTSVSKLSLPSWGKHDPATRLGPHHIRAIICLLKIVHQHFDVILSDWDLILWTFEELSIIPIASPLLSDEDYHAALSIAAVYERFAAFSTCFGDDGVVKMVETLADICESSMRDRDIVGDSETVLPEISYSGENQEKIDGRGESIGGKIMSMGVKALYGNPVDENGKADGNAPPIITRTKNVFYEEYRQLFVQRLSSSKHTVRVNSLGRVPFVLMLLADVTMANSFRSKDCQEIFSIHLSKLAALTPAVRPFVMDIMTLLIMARLSDNESSPVKNCGPGKVLFRDPMLSQLLASERTDTNPSPRNEISHVDILSPLCATIKSSERADITESALGMLSMILQGAGHLLQPMAWSLVLGTISSVSGDPSLSERRSSAPWATCCQMGFRCFKLIIDDFLDELPPTQNGHKSNRENVLDCCSSFVRSRHDVNTSLTAIGLLWTVADQDTNSDSVDLALRKFVLLASDDRAEVRNAAVNTLFSCIVGKGGAFSPERWRSCFDEAICGVYEVVASHFRSRALDEISLGSNVTSSKQSRYRVILHASRDSASKQWIATQVLVLRGLIRVLRSFFKELLDTTDSESNEESASPWFQETWVRVLDFAWEALTQEGDRESLDIRSVGTELLGIATQLTSSAGIQAAMTPARVGTNMEVVNGALRSVRESTSKSAIQRSHSMATNCIRQKLFLEAFESLESFQEVVSSNAKSSEFPTDVDLQVLHRFASSLCKVYDCCKTHELKPECPLDTSLEINTSGNTQETLEARFVVLVATILKTSSKTNQAKYLNQSQRCCVDLLRAMAAQCSYRSFEALVILAGGSFFVRKDQEIEDSELGKDTEPAITYSLLCHEAAAIVSEEIAKETISVECKIMVLELVFSEFFKEFGSADVSWRKRYYKHFIPVLRCGLSSTSQLDDESGSDVRNRVWNNLANFLSRALSLVELGQNMTKIPRVSEIIEIIEVSVTDIPIGSADALNDALGIGLVNSFAAAKQHSVLAVERSNSEIGRKSGRHRDELLVLFKLSLEQCCKLGHDKLTIRNISLDALSGALAEEQDDPAKDISIIVSQAVCETLEKYEKMQTVVVSLFPLLSQFVGSDIEELKKAALSLLKAVDVSDLLERATTRYTVAEKLADEAEKQVQKMKSIIKDLTRANEALRQDVANLEASTALHA